MRHAGVRYGICICIGYIYKCVYIYIYINEIGLTLGGSSTVHIYTQTIRGIQRTEHT
jgi:hypothetical protein